MEKVFAEDYVKARFQVTNLLRDNERIDKLYINTPRNEKRQLWTTHVRKK